MNLTLIACALTAIGAGASGILLGRAQGFREGVKRVFKDVEDTGTAFAYNHVLLGYTMTEGAWMAGRDLKKFDSAIIAGGVIAASAINSQPFPGPELVHIRSLSDVGGPVGVLRVSEGKRVYTHPHLNIESIG